MTESKTVLREKFFLLCGAIIGISFGFVGNILATYMYEYYKDTPMIHVIAFVLAVYLIAVLSVMTFHMVKIGKKISK